MIHITGLYAALGGVLIVVLALRVVLLRNRARVGLGSGKNEALARAIRVHANATEYLPLALILLLLLELGQTQPWLLHLFGIVLILARVLHALGLSSHSGYSFGRLVGTALTLLVILAMALLLVWRFIALHVIAAG